MAQVTVRRWIDARVDTVWARLIDVDTLADVGTGFDLVEVVSDGHLQAGDLVVLSRRHGARLATFQVRVVAALPPRHLSLSVASGRLRWMIRIDVEPLGDGSCDIAIRAQHDQGRAGIVPLAPPSPAAVHRLDADLTELLETIAHRAEATPPRSGSQRIAAGR